MIHHESASDLQGANTIWRNWKSQDGTDAGLRLREYYARLAKPDLQLALPRNQLKVAKRIATQLRIQAPLSFDANGEREPGPLKLFPMRKSHAFRSTLPFAGASIGPPQAIAILD